MNDNKNLILDFSALSLSISWEEYKQLSFDKQMEMVMKSRKMTFSEVWKLYRFSISHQNEEIVFKNRFSPEKGLRKIA